MENEELNKSMDALIDELFADETNTESVEKSMIKDEKPAKETADEAVKQAPKAEKDESRDAGRPEQISDIPQTDTDGKREGQYDGDIAKKNEDAKKKEDDQVEPSKEMKKSLSVGEYEEYIALKKAKEAETKVEELKKAKQEQADLIKSVVAEAIAPWKQENEELKKSLQEQSDLIKSIANKPQKSKAITNLQTIEKSFNKNEESESNTLSKSEVLDIAEELVKSGKLDMNHVIEFENTGYIYEPEARKTLEKACKRK